MRYSVLAEGYGNVRESVAVRGSGESTVEVVLTQGFRITGRVTDPEGRPLRGAKVSTFFQRAAGQATESDENGDYEITSAQLGLHRHYVFAVLDGYSPSQCTVEGSDAEARGDITMHPGATIRGRVFGPTGIPVQGAIVKIGRSSTRRVTLPDGQFELRDVGPGAQDLKIYRRGFAPASEPLNIESGKDVDGIAVTLRVGLSIAGRVTDTEGNPAPNVHIRPLVGRRYHPDGTSAYLDHGATTDADGRYLLGDLPEAVHSVDLIGVGFVPVRSAMVRPGQRDANFRLTRSVNLRGLVVDGRTGDPIQDFRIRILSASTSIGATWVREGYRFQSPDGTWKTEREPIEPGAKFTLEARAEGLAPCVVQDVEAVKDMAPIVFELMPGKGLIGRVLDTATGLAVRGIEVELVSAESQPTGDRNHPASRRLDTTNAEGRFTFEDLPSAQYRIVLRRENKVVQVSAPVSPRTPAEDRTIWLRATNIVTGTLLSPNGTRLPGYCR